MKSRPRNSAPGTAATRRTGANSSVASRWTRTVLTTPSKGRSSKNSQTAALVHGAAVLFLSPIRQSLQIIERVKSGGMPIRPQGLNGVAADRRGAHQHESPRIQRRPGGLVNISEDIRLSFASGAGA